MYVSFILFIYFYLYSLFLLVQIFKVFRPRVCNELCVATSFLLTSGCLYIPHISWKHEAQYLLTTACYLSRDETNNLHNFVDYIYYLTTPTCFGLQGQLQEQNSTYINYSYSKSQQDALFLNFILVKTLHVSDRFTVHHQES